MSALPQAVEEIESEAAPAVEKERRATPRFTLLIQTAKLISQQGDFLCIVRDASQEGVRVRHFGYLPKDKFIEFELANGSGFPVELVWQDEEYAGLKFPREVDLAEIVKTASTSLPKRQLRLRTELEGTLSFADLRLPVTIRNLSQQGACIATDEKLAIQQLVKIETEDLEPVFAKVRWRKGNVCGLVFLETLSLGKLAAIASGTLKHVLKEEDDAEEYEEEDEEDDLEKEDEL